MTALDIGLLVVRLVVGLTFAAHGAQKVLGWWSGPGFAGWTGAMTRMGLRPAPLWAALSTAIELVGGLLVVVGLLTPIASAVVVAVLGAFATMAIPRPAPQPVATAPQR